jgi:hypothetical protein
MGDTASSLAKNEGAHDNIHPLPRPALFDEAFAFGQAKG